jgi:hypothetical protein
LLAPPLLPTPQPNPVDYIFTSGLWYNRYSQFGVWHGPFQHLMTFNPYNNTITGSGVNDVGEFTMNGYYSRATLQIMMNLAYKVRDLVLVLLINKFHSTSSSIRFS